MVFVICRVKIYKIGKPPEKIWEWKVKKYLDKIIQTNYFYRLIERLVLHKYWFTYKFESHENRFKNASLYVSETSISAPSCRVISPFFR